MDDEEIDLYLRKSKIVQAGTKALTFRTQEDRGRAWAKANGKTVRKVWKDNLSAWSVARRPDFEKALKALQNQEVPALWCYAVDRFSREGAARVAAVLDQGARLIFDYERLDSADPRDRERIISDAERAKSASDLTSYRVKDTKKGQRDRGEWLGAAPYGLKKTAGGKLKPRKKTWPVIERVFDETASGISGRAVARSLTNDQIPSPDGGQWGASTVRRIIANPVYEGWQVLVISRAYTWPRTYRNAAGKRVKVFAKGFKPISADLANRARRVSAGHQRGSLGSRVGRATHLLTDLLVCAGCGSKMPTSGRSYVCCGHASGKNCPAPASAMKIRIEAHIYDCWVARLTAAEPTDPLLAAVARRWQALTEPEMTEESQEAVAAVKAAEAALEQLANDRKAGHYDGAMGKHFGRLVKEAEEDLRNAKAHADQFTAQTLDITVFTEEDLLTDQWTEADLPMRRDLLRVAIGKVTVTQAQRRGAPFVGDDRCSIEWHDE